MQKENLFISRIYRSVTEIQLPVFKTWALESFRSLVPFDAAIWISGTNQDIELNRITILGLSREQYIQSLESNKGDFQLLPLLTSTPSRTYNLSDIIPDSQFYNSPFYKDHAEAFHLERVLGTSYLDDDSGLLDLVVLYRHDRSNLFTEQERKTTENITPHLINAASHAIFMNMRLQLLNEYSSQSVLTGAGAIADHKSRLIEVEPKFLKLLRHEYPTWQGPGLPFRLPEIHEDTLIYEGDVWIKARPAGDVIYLRMEQPNPIEQLTGRERDVVLALLGGLTTKEIGKQLDISPSTVANHLNRIYNKFQIENRSQLVSLCLPHIAGQIPGQ